MNFKKYTVDFSGVKHYLEMHKVIKDSLGFPDYYGANWDAFWDCLTDMYGEKIHIEIKGSDIINERFGKDVLDKMIEILKRFKYFSKAFENDIKIEIIKNSKIISIE